MGQKNSPLFTVAAVLVFAPLLLFSQQVKKEIDVGFASLDQVKPILREVLSPTGKFVVLQAKGTVLVIDDIDHIAKAEAALAAAVLPNPNVDLHFAFKTGLPPRRTRIEVTQEIPFPTAWDPPQIPSTVMVNPGPGGVVVFPITPAHPTNFVRRKVGFISDTVSTVNPDGSITMDVNIENSQFEGFINYGSAILPAGQVGVVPITNQVGNPTFFQPLIPNNILMPIISTTRISTSVVIRPRVVHGAVNLDMIPRFTVHADQEIPKDQAFDLRQFQTTMGVSNNGVGRIYGFAGAEEDFNRNFLAAKDVTKGSVAIEVTAKITPGKEETESVPSED